MTLAGNTLRWRWPQAQRNAKTRCSTTSTATTGVLAAEKLREVHGLKLSVETMRQQMVLHGYWKARPGKAVISHPMRERRLRRGELVQIDVSRMTGLRDARRAAPCWCSLTMAPAN